MDKHCVSVVEIHCHCDSSIWGVDYLIIAIVWIPNVIDASLRFTAGENCSYPFTYNGQLYYSCAALPGVTNDVLPYGCVMSDGNPAICYTNTGN